MIEDVETQDDVKDVKAFHEEMKKGKVDFVSWEVAKKEIWSEINDNKI